MGQVTVTEDECVGRACPFHEACYTTLARERAAHADVTITNHALLLLDAQLRYATAGKAAVLPPAEALVVDEAHDLAEIARTVLGEQLSFSYGRTLSRRLPRLPYGDTGHGMEALALDRALGVWAQDLHERLVALQKLGDGGRQTPAGGRAALRRSRPGGGPGPGPHLPGDARGAQAGGDRQRPAGG